MTKQGFPFGKKKQIMVKYDVSMIGTYRVFDYFTLVILYYCVFSLYNYNFQSLITEFLNSSPEMV